jgi:diguanylate cyclase (GGDEF)-like protein
MGFRLLIVDDSDAIRAEIKSVLVESPDDIEFAEAANGVEALKTLTTSAIDLVLCDVQMPVMDGFQFLRLMRARPEQASTPIIMLTGHDDPAEKVFGLENGATDYVTKPFMPGELAARVHVQLKLKSLQDDLRNMSDRFRDLSNTDFLTNLFNRRYFMEVAGLELKRCQRYKLTVSLLMVDLDHFKRINDTLGHHAGDQVLIELGQVMRSVFRTTDVVARYGGEEFVLMLPQTTVQEAKQPAEKLRALLKQTAIGPVGVGELSCSIGAAQFPAQKVDSLESLIERADQALYRAKTSGRDRVVLDDDKA